ncbi:MAG: hypothetical protein C4B58_14415 [Deltaproteobacteria bacterium]|nr:MAG: hypothetical protein C4B58_14415 [Deltaproteobacteria bacterium]
MFYVYVLRSELDKNFYVGYTKNLKLRFENRNMSMKMLWHIN